MSRSNPTIIWLTSILNRTYEQYKIFIMTKYGHYRDMQYRNIVLDRI
jgi:hypothetical protein